MRATKFSNRRSIGMLAVAGVAAVAPVAALAATSSAPAGAAPAVAACPTSGLVVWLDTAGSGAAGSTFYSLELTNLSGHTCTLQGYPGVSAVNLSGAQLGRAASHDPAHKPAVVKLVNDASATVILRIVEAGNYPTAACQPVTAAGLRVYPPGRRVSKIVPYPFAACSHSGPIYLSVEAVTKA